MKGRLRDLVARARGHTTRPMILMYHRVATLAHDPWELAVSPDRFGAQLDHLVRCRTPMPLDAFVEALDAGRLPSDAVAVTFDDGYADNYHVALPMLRDRDISATLFLVTGCVDAGRAFWWDELARLILDHREPADACVRITASEFRLKWNEAIGEPVGWRAVEAPNDPRHMAFLDIWRALRALTEPDRQAVLAQLRAVLGPVNVNEDRAMTRAELDAFASSGTFTIGAHSRTHAALPALPAGEAAREIEGSKAECESIIGRPVTGFAYPYGDMSEAIRNQVARSGFSWACSTEAGPVSRKGYDRFALPRLAVGDWDVDRFAKALAA